MMKRRLATVFIFLISAAFLVGCAAQQKMAEKAAFEPVDVADLMMEGKYEQKVDNFMVILDASGTMQDQGWYEAKEVVRRMNLTIPELEFTAALRTFGHYFSNTSALVYGPTAYEEEAFGAALEEITGFGLSPLGGAISGATKDLQSAGGAIAVIVVSDGLETDEGALEAARAMKGEFGDRVCIYPVLVGDAPEGERLMNQLASACGCGFSTKAEDLMAPGAMADFVTKVFFRKVEVPAAPKLMDSDKDGVFDKDDQCPNTPEGVAVDERGCPFDNDGDGVYNYEDQCAKTPEGADVDARGCWVLEGVYFDTAKAELKKTCYPVLNEVVTVLEKNPQLEVEIQGHTDNRGSAAYNQKLSEERANAVMNYLVNQGISADRLTAKGYGLSEPAVPNTSARNMALNRRVELKPTW